MNRPRAAVLVLPILIVAGACSEQNVLPGMPSAPSGLCVYPRACYQVSCDCRGGPEPCRVVSIADMGFFKTDMGAPPTATDHAEICPDTGLFASTCLVPDTVCVAKGPACETACASSMDRCKSPPRIPQEGRDGVRHCPWTDDVCCPVPDAGTMDMSGDGA